MTVLDTNICNERFPEILVAIRGLFLFLMSWLLYQDFKLKQAINFQKYTIWGEISTFVTFLLLFICSVEKYAYQTLYKLFPNKEVKFPENYSSKLLSKVTAFMF